MQRRSFIKSASLFAGLLTFPLMKAKAQSPSKKVNFRHVVYFWLNEPEDPSQKKIFLENLKYFIGNMDNILDSHIGVPADTHREVIDNTYQYCLNLGFENKTEQEIYQEHPLHKQFIEKSVHLWKRVLVYDSVAV
jgi:hypothetical protein